MVTTGWIGSSGKVVRNLDEAASLLAHIRKSAQEQIFLVTTDKNGLVLEVQRYSKGLVGSASLNPPEMVAHNMNIEGATNLYFAHNHPSRDISPSPEDRDSTEFLKRVAEISGLDVKGFVIGGTKYIDIQTGKIEKIKPILRTLKLPVKERNLQVKAGYEKLPDVHNSKAAFEYMDKVHKNAEGLQ